MEQLRRQEPVNMTEALEALSPWLNHPRRTVVLAEAFTAGIAGLLLLQLILGSYRRQSSCALLHAATWLAYTLPSPLIAYTLGLMQSSPVKNALYPVWAASLVVAAAGTNAIKAYQLDDNNQWMRSLFDSFQYLAYSALIIGLLAPQKKSSDVDFHDLFNFKKAVQVYQSPPVTKLVCLAVITLYHSKAFPSLLVARGNWDRRVAEFMKKRKAETTDGGLNPHSMQGYKYPVRFKVSQGFTSLSVSFLPSAIRRRYLRVLSTVSDDAITIEDIWRCEAQQRRPLPEDVCLAFSLYELLKMRYYGMAFPEKLHGKISRDFFEGFLQTEDGYQRAFRIVEAELGFCHDYFFTEYPLIFEAEEVSFCLFLTRVILLILIGVDVLKNSLSFKTTRAIIRVHTATADSMITLVILGIILIIEVLQAALYVASDWFKVSVTCWYVRLTRCQGNACVEKLISGFIGIPKVRSYWKNRIGQCSIISDSTADIGDASELNKVKKAVASYLKSCGGKLTNGEESLRNNGLSGELTQSWQGKSQAEAMLIWNVATEYCNAPSPTNGTATNEQEPTKSLRQISVIISRYCAYLMDSAPELLPGYFGDTKFALVDLQNVVSKVASSPNDRKYQAMKDLRSPLKSDADTIFKKGRELGEKLEGLPNAQRWKVMADFWTEKILYIAPSENVKGHMERLAEGGEFLTHIWVLLTHAGILRTNREQGQSSTPNQPPTPQTNA